MDSGLYSTSATSGAQRYLWPGLWAPVVILVLGITLNLLAANLAATQAEELTRKHYHARHQALVSLVTNQLRGPNGIDTGPLQTALATALPEHLSLRIDTLDRHTKQPWLELGQTEAPLNGLALRSELDAAGSKWMVTTLPGEGMLANPATNLYRQVLAGGFVLTLLAFALSLYLCWQNKRRQQVIGHQHRTLRAQSQQIANLQVEKAVLRQALNESEARSRDLVTLSGAITAELDDQGRIGFISSLAADLLGQAPSDLDQRVFSDLVAETDQQRFLECLQASRSDDNVARVDLTLTRRDGESAVPVTLRIKALKDAVQGLTGYRLSAQPTG